MSISSTPSFNPNLDSSNIEQLKDGTRVTLVGLKTEAMNGLTGKAFTVPLTTVSVTLFASMLMVNR
jgi:hypothetical protein